ncbi:MAG: recombinase family protein [Lachnospiraceae bacterium]|nr:recombinase family protein [Lachnospiraceae bacterium]
MYSRDISKKVLAGIMTRSRQGKFCGGTPPYGLKRDPADKGHLIINEEEAPVIRHIYELALNGYGNMRISKQLMEEKVPITRVKASTECDVNYYAWSVSRISTILRNPFYKGAHVVCKTHQKAIRSNTYNIIPREEREVIEDCHEAIISKEDWDRVQELIDRRPPIMQGNSCPYHNIFHGIVYCATCGRSMQVRYEKVGRTDKNRTTKKMREPIDKAYYICQTYNRMGKDACTSHKIEARALTDLVLKDIQDLAKEAMKDADAFYNRLAKRMEKQYRTDFTELKKEYGRLQSRNEEIDGIIGSLYADKSKGILSEKRFVKMLSDLETEQSDNEARMQELSKHLNESDAQDGDIRLFIDEIRKVGVIRELDEAVLNRLIDKIFIGETIKTDQGKVQEVRIVYNFVGEVSGDAK